MKNNAFLILFLVFSTSGVQATEPTTQSSTFTHNNKQCISVNLQWTNGNGSARIIIAKMGSKPDFAPVDGQVYSANAAFGKSLKFGAGNDNFIVYNSNSTNFVKIDSLLPCTKYYFTIYEHDNGGSSTDYLTSGAPTDSVDTYCTKLDFKIIYHDSCQIKNLIEFVNTSTTNIPGVTYKFEFADGDSSSLNPAFHSYKISGLIPAKIKINTNIKGCQTIFAKGVRIYQKKVVFIDFSQGADTVQCLDGNLFKFKTGNFTNPLSGSYGYRWFTETDTSVFSFFQHTYLNSGRRKVSLEITTNISKGPNTYPTACKDTLTFEVLVLPSPVGNISPFDTTQCLKHNSYFFNNPDNTLVSFNWDFGDGNSSPSKSVVHKYNAVGTYRVIHEAVASTGCIGKDTVYVKILPDLDSKFTGLDSHYCTSNQFVDLKPNKSGGQFSGYPLTHGDSIIPSIPGTYTLQYIYKDKYCSDTSFKKFIIDKAPTPDLGNDVAVCSSASHTLDANETGTYLWNTLETTQSITVTASGKYYVDVTQGTCTTRDIVDVVFTTKPKLNLGSDTILCKGGSLRLNASSPTATYMWSTGSTDSFIYAFTPGKYFVTVTNPCGVTKDSLYVNFQTDYCDLFMANAFTPGNDLVNNVFMPRGRNITVKEFQIFDRWGELIFETNENNVGWDGTYMGDYVPDGLYIWRLHYTTPNGPYIKKNNAFGQVLLIR